MQSIRRSLARAGDALRALSESESLQSDIARAIDIIAGALQAGHKVLAIGNGGSCADAVHFCEELTGRFRKDRCPLAAIACADAGHITCTANDYGFDEVFARWVTALARPGDVLVALSTSGNSPNILKALDAAEAAKAHRIALLGRDGGVARTRCDLSLIVPGETTDRIQELHMLILHMIVECVEAGM